MSLEDDIKSIAKEGADISGVLGQLEGLNPLNGLTKETAFDFIKKNPVLLSTFDSEVSKSVNTGVDNFKQKGMQEIIKEREEAIRKELNPEETPEQKRIRELETKLEASDGEKALAKLQDELSTKAKELEFDPIKARDFAVWGENAMSKLEEYATWQNETLNSRLDSEIKTKFNGNPPKRTNLPPADLDTRIKEARAAGNTDLALKLQMMKTQKKA
jgi:hypothetical protein